jgi:sugar-specific transcriptional regulator TrmB
MDNFIDYLKQLELSDVEAKLYLTLLQAGPISVRDLAQKIDIKRTTAYFYIDQLTDKGLTMKLVKGSKKLIAANEPNNLKTLLEKKMEQAKKIQQGFPKIIKTLNMALPKNTSSSEGEIKYYKGTLGVRKVYDEALRSNELRSYVKVEASGGIFSNNVKLFSKALKINKKLTVKEIIYDSPSATKDAQEILQINSGRYAFKLMPKELNLTSGDELIYDGKVAVITYKGNMNSIVLHNNDYFNNSKVLFDFIWNMI